MKKKVRKSTLFILFLSIFLFFCPLIYARNWEQYIINGIYYAIKDGQSIKCGRVGEDDPQKRYEWYNFNDVDDCWNHRCNWGMCKGEVPLCCYKLEETGNAKACPWPERGYCHPRQCEKILGDKLLCSHGIGYWCKKDCGIDDKYKIPYIPFEQRISSLLQLTPTNTPIPTPTNYPTSTFAPPANIPLSTVTLIPTSTPQPLLSPIPTLSLFGPTPTSFILPTLTSYIHPKKNSFDFSRQTQFPSPSPSNILIIKTPNFQNFKIELLSPKTKLQLRSITLSSRKILDLPKIIINDIISLDKKIETTINNNLKKIFSFIMRKENRNSEGECYQVNSKVQAIYSDKKVKLISLKIDDKPVEDDKEYTICMQNYHYNNCQSYLNIPQEELNQSGKTKVITTSAQQVLEEYFRNHPNSQAKVEGRLVYQ
jgi:hypothetical protein